jgi:hypothetical protein
MRHLKMIKKISRVLMLFFYSLYLIQPLLASELLNNNHLGELLQTGFESAMASPEEFKNTRAFHNLEYSDEEIARIGKITPKPKSLSVNFEKMSEPGGFRSIKVVCSEVSYYNLTIATATFEFKDSFLNMKSLRKGKIRFDKSGSINLNTKVSEEDILKVFEMFARARKLNGLKLKLTSERARLDGWYRNGLIVIKFRVVGNTRLVNCKRVDFEGERLTLNRIRLPRNTARSILRSINPVFDSTRTWLNLNINKISIKEGFVETVARIDKKKGSIKKNAHSEKNL